MSGNAVMACQEMKALSPSEKCEKIHKEHYVTIQSIKQKAESDGYEPNEVVVVIAKTDDKNGKATAVILCKKYFQDLGNNTVIGLAKKGMIAEIICDICGKACEALRSEIKLCDVVIGYGTAKTYSD